MTFAHILKKHKYELLLFGLMQHLFMGILLADLEIYRNIFWPINMIILGFTSFGIYLEHNKKRIFILRVLVLTICATPLLARVIGFSSSLMIYLSISYVLFFIYVFYEIFLFLVKPSYINKDVIVASGCGYLLLIEIATFTQQTIYTFQPLAYTGLDTSHPTASYIDFVYFSSITLTSIGFGDILPNMHYSKLLTALIGIAGQFYSVILVGILISKFTAQNNK